MKDLLLLIFSLFCIQNSEKSIKSIFNGKKCQKGSNIYSDTSD